MWGRTYKSSDKKNNHGDFAKNCSHIIFDRRSEEHGGGDNGGEKKLYTDNRVNFSDECPSQLRIFLHPRIYLTAGNTVAFVSGLNVHTIWLEHLVTFCFSRNLIKKLNYIL